MCFSESFVVLEVYKIIAVFKGGLKEIYLSKALRCINCSYSNVAKGIRLLDKTAFYTPPHFSVGVLCYTFRCLSVCPSIRPSVLTISNR